MSRPKGGRKACTYCGVTKLLTEFHRHRSHLSGGRESWCKECQHIRHSKAYVPLGRHKPKAQTHGAWLRKNIHIDLKAKPVVTFSAGSKGGSGDFGRAPGPI